MNDQRRPIQVDHQGRPITDGIPVRNNVEYAAKAGTGILIAHFLFHPVAILYWAAVFLFGALWLAPGWIVWAIVLATHSHSTVAGVFAVVGLVLEIAGFIMWMRQVVRYTKRMAKWFMRSTKMRFVGNYRGPVAPVTDYLAREREQRSKGH